jgi:hypothetical protein
VTFGITTLSAIVSTGTFSRTLFSTICRMLA